MITSLLILCAAFGQDPPAEARYGRVHDIFVRHCLGCHNAKEAEGQLVLESHAGLMKGGENGAVVVPGKPAESRILKAVEHREKPFMPPPKKGARLNPGEIALLRAWVEAGALAPKPGEVAAAGTLPRIEPKVAPRKPIHAIAWEPKQKLIAVARHGEVELRSAESRGIVRVLAGHAGNVNDVAFTADGALLAAAGGAAGRSGEILLWQVADGKLLRTIKGHQDAIHAVAFSPDGKRLAAAGYDRKVSMWDASTGMLVRGFEGHNEAVFDVAFRPDGRILASASADRTVKLWDAATGARRETLSESGKALHSLAFSPDGKHLAAGGADNRIRIWEIGPDGAEGTNPIRASHFAHEGAILAVRYSPDGKRLLSSADDRTVKLWKVPDLSPGAALEAQSDWPAAVGFAPDGKTVVVGRLDGSLGFYDAATGNPVAAAKPEPATIEHRVVQSGGAMAMVARGKNLAWLTGVKTNHAGLSGEISKDDPGKADLAGILLRAARSVPPGAYEIRLTNEGGESAPLKVFVDALPVTFEVEGKEVVQEIPSSVWGVLDRAGDVDPFIFNASKGSTIVLDVGAKRLGSKSEPVLVITDGTGRALASSTRLERDVDPLVSFTAPADGRYVARVSDLQATGSADHFYRLSIPDRPVVTGCYPLSVPAGVETRVGLLGPAVPPDAFVTVTAAGTGEVALPVDPDRYFLRRDLKVLVVAGAPADEIEPNDLPAKATALSAPGTANGRIGAPGDADLFRFETKAGREWVIETEAARRGSPADTRVEILHADGRPVVRLLLRAVRDSWITFNGFGSNAGGARLWNWEEMDLDQYVYMNGEVARLFLHPRGPDSEFDFYKIGDKRRCYFDTSATAHALDEQVYIVEPHPPGAAPASNGLPVFPLHYANDDDALRGLGSDSRLHFTAPAEGAYLVRVTDALGSGGDRHAYRLIVRESKPDFRAVIEGANPSIPAGSGLGFTVRVERIDGFDGPVRVDITGLPPGYVASTPIVVEAGHVEAKGTLHAAEKAPKPGAGNWAASKVTATAIVSGREVLKQVNTFGKFELRAKPQVRVWLESEGRSPASAEATAGRPEITVEPGKEVAAILRIERKGFAGRVQLDVENLPHGAIVSDIGLNGVLIVEGQTERRIFIKCGEGVAEQSRVCHARSRDAGNPTSPPVMLHVRRGGVR